MTRDFATKAEEILASVPVAGETIPRLSSPVAGSGTFGPEVAAWAKAHMPYPPMPWNELAWDRVLEHNEAGELVHRQALVTTARQNSKTTWAEALVGWWLTDRADRAGPQSVCWLSHDLRLSEHAFRFVALALESRITRVIHSFGRQVAVFDNGSQFMIGSNTPGAGHGYSLDLCVADESWRLRPAAINDGIIPSMRARKHPLLVMTSTAGDEDSTLLRQWRERGLASVESGERGSLCFLEWSMPPGADWHDPSWWGHPNPCLGVTLDRDTLVAEYLGPDRNAFLRGSLNVWTASAESWLQPGVWDGCAAKSVPDPVGGVVAGEVAQGGERFYALRAWQHDGITYVAPLIVSEHEEAFWGAMEAVYGQVDTLALTPSLDPHVPNGMRRKVTTVGLRELARWVPLVRSMVTAGQVAHERSPTLDEHVGRAVPTRTAGLSTAASSGSIELARCLVWAVALASRPQSRRKPAVGVAREN